MNNTIEKPIESEKKGLSMIWLLPLLTITIGLSMVYHHWQERGITIQIQFEHASGLVVGKTKVKSRNVDIGIVTEIEFSKDYKSIIAKAEINNSMKDLLVHDSRFWVVRPRIGSTGISGISTLLSGAYIELQPGTTTKFTKTYIGLENPPITAPNSAGAHYSLTSNGGKRLHIGNPVIYRGFKVGTVEKSEFDIKKGEVNYDIFIRAPYHNLVTSNTHFWLNGGLSISSSSEGIKVEMGSLETLISGGVTFDIPDGFSLGERISEEKTFRLFGNYHEALSDRDYEYLEYILLVEGSVAGLKKGAPVEFSGIRVGTVASPFIGFDKVIAYDRDNEKVPVVLHIEPERIPGYHQYSLPWFKQLFDSWILEGISGSIVNANLLTGKQKIALSLRGKALTKLSYFGESPIIPSHQEGMKSIAIKMEAVLDKIHQLEIETTLKNSNMAITSATESFQSLTATLNKLTLALDGLQPDSPLYQSVDKAVNELKQLLDDMQPLVQSIKNKPSALLFSPPVEPDEEPGGKPNE